MVWAVNKNKQIHKQAKAIGNILDCNCTILSQTQGFW